MEWESLPTDYTDAVWSGLKKYTQVNNSDGTVSFNDVTTYTNKEKSFFGAKDANRMNEALNTIMSKLENYIDTHNAGVHNAIYRGESLGSTVTTAQSEAISQGTFKDLYIGDYWTINNINYRIAAFDYYYRRNDSSTQYHHVLIVPDTSICYAPMHSTATTSGGYVNSDMYTTHLEEAKTIIYNAFGKGKILSNRIFASNSCEGGLVTGQLYAASTIDLMCEQMVCGSRLVSPGLSPSLATVYNLSALPEPQLPLFQYNPSLVCCADSTINNRKQWWLRDTVTDTAFACINPFGSVDSVAANATTGTFGALIGIRPSFCIMK